MRKALRRNAGDDTLAEALGALLPRDDAVARTPKGQCGFYDLVEVKVGIEVADEVRPPFSANKSDGARPIADG
jgi:hypothetical protein